MSSGITTDRKATVNGCEIYIGRSWASGEEGWGPLRAYVVYAFRDELDPATIREINKEVAECAADDLGGCEYRLYSPDDEKSIQPETIREVADQICNKPGSCTCCYRLKDVVNGFTGCGRMDEVLLGYLREKQPLLVEWYRMWEGLTSPERKKRVADGKNIPSY